MRRKLATQDALRPGSTSASQYEPYPTRDSNRRIVSKITTDLTQRLVGKVASQLRADSSRQVVTTEAAPMVFQIPLSPATWIASKLTT